MSSEPLKLSKSSELQHPNTSESEFRTRIARKEMFNEWKKCHSRVSSVRNHVASRACCDWLHIIAYKLGCFYT